MHSATAGRANGARIFHDTHEDGDEFQEQTQPPTGTTRPGPGVAAMDPPAQASPHQHTPMTAVARRVRAAGFTVRPRGTVDEANENEQDSKTNSNAEILTLLKTMQEAMKNKDDIISKLQDTIAGLNSQIATMTATINSMQATATTRRGRAGRSKSRSEPPAGRRTTDDAARPSGPWDGTW